MSERPVIYGYGASTYTRMALVAADEKGIDYSFQAVASWDGYRKIPEFQGLHPFRKVPVLEHRGSQITETIAILSYIERNFDGPSLMPTNALEIARMWEMISTTVQYAWPVWVPILATHRLFNPMAGDPTDEELIAKRLPDMRHAATEIGKLIARRGETFDLADIVLAGAFKYVTETPETGDILGASQELAIWWRRASERPSVARHMPDTDWPARTADMAASRE
ncbi:MAG: glutathione S-transferase family protein [Alphaproteobacteria bacterium]